MKSFRLLVLGIAFAAAVLVFFFSRSTLTSFFGNLHSIISTAADSDFSRENYEKLKIQNEALIQSVSDVQNPNPIIAAGRYRYREARVFSDYPFNNYASIVIDAGSDDGMKAGMPVLSAPGVLLGRIKNVTRTQSEVETIFDPNWRSAAAIGPERTKSLLVGGPAPYLDLVPKSATSTEGEAVANLAGDFPMNLLIGKIFSWEADGNGVWAKAKVEPPVNFGDLETVLVIVNFP